MSRWFLCWTVSVWLDKIGRDSGLCLHTSALGIENCVEVLILETHGCVGWPFFLS